MPAGKLEAAAISKRLAGRDVLDDVSLSVEPGEVVGLLGPNGAGKSTLLRILIGLLRADSGRVLLDGQPIDRWPTYRRARAGLGYLAQESSAFVGLSARQNLEAVLELCRRPRSDADPLLEALGLSARRDQRAGTLSGGERRRLEIARLLAQRPRVLLLDEPLRGLDRAAREILRERLLGLIAEGCTILFCDHPAAADPALGLCRRSYVLAEGRLVTSGQPARFVDSPVGLMTAS